MGRENSLLLVAALFSLLSCSHVVVAQVKIPARFDGFVYGAGAPAGHDTVVVEAFFDPLCPDSRDAWPHLERAVKRYSPRVFLTVHPFALPYHDNAFVASRALHIANKLNASATYPLLDLFFKYQAPNLLEPNPHGSHELKFIFELDAADLRPDTEERYYNKPTRGLSRASIVHRIATLAAMAVGKSSSSAIESGFEDSNTDMATRVSFKYGCSRGVTGTPYFFVNGFPLPDGGTVVDYDKWRSIIDPLVKKV